MKPCKSQQVVYPRQLDSAHLEGVTAISFPVNHLHNVFIHRLAALVTVTPVVGRTHAILSHVKVLGVVDVPVRPRLDSVEDLPKRLSI